jgi:hypothetical protein
MYQERRARSIARGRSRARNAERVALSACPSAGPAMLVNDAIRPAKRSLVTNSQPWMPPQSWPTRCTGRSGATAAQTAAKSSARRAMSYAAGPRGALDPPAPRTS